MQIVIGYEQEIGGSIMPFKSRDQEKWAFATGQKFAKQWANMTDQKNLPKKVKKAKKK